jgi:hypothetical protein
MGYPLSKPQGFSHGYRGAMLAGRRGSGARRWGDPVTALRYEYYAAAGTLYTDKQICSLKIFVVVVLIIVNVLQKNRMLTRCDPRGDLPARAGKCPAACANIQTNGRIAALIYLRYILSIPLRPSLKQLAFLEMMHARTMLLMTFLF